uniref:Uncharacterized protein n=1 Tax=Percolomonas cosmopolitus TaxID=63605 RepID=A0A7S1KPH6_9EUKA|eukprot:CAMPEP_0117439458 /NCGR_PEP_ID=MMETSP0759-20121206/2575_1 /TAXON_ID=63605 /ORGANISM="Percolomonas cosmopolitus, Strain WS" /LENGTH=306 /DNA_ID=CAMNT_0005231173 /DNA_START=4 /DNA_END=924 /DNA_ORIENTATION=+
MTQPPSHIQQSIQNLKSRFRDEIKRIERHSQQKIEVLSEERDYWESEAKKMERRWQEAEGRYQSLLSMNGAKRATESDDETQDGTSARDSGIVYHREPPKGTRSSRKRKSPHSAAKHTALESSPSLGKSTKTSRLRKLTVELQQEIKGRHHGERQANGSSMSGRQKRASSTSKRRPSSARAGLSRTRDSSSGTPSKRTPRTPPAVQHSRTPERSASAKKRLSYASPLAVGTPHSNTSIIEGDLSMSLNPSSPLRSRTPETLRRSYERSSPAHLSVNVPHTGSHLSVSSDTAEMLHHIRSLKSMLGQ